MRKLAMAAAIGMAAGTAVAGERARDLGIAIGVLAPGPLNAITDVEGVRVGQVTLTEGETVRTGVTAVLPHGGNLFQDKVPAGFFVANGFGKFMGSTQVEELGEVETPILLTNTLNVAETAAGAIEWTLVQPGNEQVRSVNAVVGETNDGGLNDIRGRHLRPEHARRAIEQARGGAVEEGAVGAGTGTIAFGWKGGIGTASRRLPASLGGWTVGVLVQSNYGGVLTVAGVPVGVKLDRFDLRDAITKKADGSVVIVVATDAPLSDRNLRRLAGRTFAGIARTGGGFSNGSGDYAIAFSTHPDVRRTPERRSGVASVADMANDRMSALFQGVAEATEEAVLNSMVAARTTTGNGRTVERLPVERVQAMVKGHR
ncbi:DmpA family aminopeptidase [Sphingomonas sp.]|uniref:DmpA family aminopeptidase n=1 Tax=Sphingomonas sp. TaxID=28214 RepID=UPI002DD69241|nr:P1 family peptidase [Sphingomonas sp.]